MRVRAGDGGRGVLLRARSQPRPLAPDLPAGSRSQLPGGSRGASGQGPEPPPLPLPLPLPLWFPEEAASISFTFSEPALPRVGYFVSARFSTARAPCAPLPDPAGALSARSPASAAMLSFSLVLGKLSISLLISPLTQWPRERALLSSRLWFLRCGQEPGAASLTPAVLGALWPHPRCPGPAARAGDTGVCSAPVGGTFRRPSAVPVTFLVGVCRSGAAGT